MSDALQKNDAVPGITIDEGVLETVELSAAESGAELAPATEENQDNIDDSKALEVTAQEKAQKAINKQHAKYREEERKRIAVETENAEIKAKLEALEAKTGVVEIPPMPESWEDDFQEKVAARDEAIALKARQDMQKQSLVEAKTKNEEAVANDNVARVTALVGDYNKRTVTLGLNPEEIAKAGDKVVDYGIDGNVAEFILKQDDGPLITKYLADNPLELDNLRSMSAIDAAFKISTDIRPLASSLKPRASDAPDPAETLAGRGAGEQVHPLISGATFT